MIYPPGVDLRGCPLIMFTAEVLRSIGKIRVHHQAHAFAFFVGPHVEALGVDNIELNFRLPR